MKPYLIVTHPWRRQSAGVCALHRLASFLQSRGCVAYTTTQTPLKGVKMASSTMAAGIARDGIVVYPEVEKGNPLHARRVVRYLLNVPGLIRGDKTFPESELIFAYSGLLRGYLRDPENILTVPVTSDEFLKPVGNHKRNTALVWKGAKTKVGQELCIDAELAREITFDWPRTHRVLAEQFRRADVFYSYQNYTNLTIEARLCGCPAVIIPNGIFTREQFETSMPGINGLAFGNTSEEVARAASTVGAFVDDFKAMTDEFYNVQLDTFIEKTQEGFF